MDSESKNLIRTTNGPKSKESFQKFESVLPYEHITQNLCDFIYKPE
jgi:hypothetical protein